MAATGPSSGAAQPVGRRGLLARLNRPGLHAFLRAPSALVGLVIVSIVLLDILLAPWLFGHGAETQEHVAAIVVDRRILRIELDGAVEVLDGLLGLLQPRVGVSLPSAGRSWFVRLFAGDAGIDPYTRAVSDVYQDLFREGSFIGKGIYDVDAFERALAGRFPENTILSHDLLESCHARSGLVSDVEIYEEYPSRYNVDITRRHVPDLFSLPRPCRARVVLH